MAAEEDQCLAGFLFTGVWARGREEGQKVLLGDAAWAVNCLEHMHVSTAEGIIRLGSVTLSHLAFHKPKLIEHVPDNERSCFTV